VGIRSLTRRGRQRFYGWWIVFVGATLNAYGAGVNFYGFSVFFSPMREEFGWTYAQTAAAFSLSRLQGGPLGPIVGWFIDRVGTRRMAVIGITITGAGFVSMYAIQSLWMFYIIYGVFISTGFSIGFFHVTNAMAANWFVKKRSRALSYLAVGAGVGGAVLVPLLGLTMGLIGWRLSAVGIGVLMWVVGIPLALTIRHRPEDMGQLPDGEPVEAESPARATTSAGAVESAAAELEIAREASSPALEEDFTVGEALRTSAFWVFTLALTLRACILSSIVVHQIPRLEDINIDRETASAILGLMILLSLPGRLFFGWLGDILSKRHLLAATCVLQGIGLLIFANATSLVYVFPYLLIYGLGYGGAIPLATAFRADLFGRKAFATISGVMMAVTTVGTVIAPVFAGWVHDVTDSYKIAFYTFTVLILISAVGFLFVPKPERSPAATSLAAP
jgi:MFS family permease